MSERPGSPPWEEVTVKRRTAKPSVSPKHTDVKAKENIVGKPERKQTKKKSENTYKANKGKVGGYVNVNDRAIQPESYDLEPVTSNQHGDVKKKIIPQQSGKEQRVLQKSARKPVKSVQVNSATLNIKELIIPSIASEQDYPRLGTALQQRPIKVTTLKEGAINNGESCRFSENGFKKIVERSDKSESQAPISYGTMAASISSGQSQTSSNTSQANHNSRIKRMEGESNKEKVVPTKPRTGQPIQLSLADMLVMTKRTKRTVIRQHAYRNPRVAMKERQGKRTTGNALDSTGPIVRRGKERETPRPRRPTKLKCIIKQAREMRRKLRMGAVRDRLQPEHDGLVVTLATEDPTPASESQSKENNEWENVDEVEEAVLERKSGSKGGESVLVVGKEKDGTMSQKGNERVVTVQTEKERAKGANGLPESVKEDKLIGIPATPIVKEEKPSSNHVHGQQEQLDERRVRDFDFFHGTKTSPNSCLYNNIATIHHAKFRGYCTNLVDSALEAITRDLIKELIAFQERKMQSNPLKAKRRYYRGLNEVVKTVSRNLVKCLIVATDIEDISLEGGLNDKMRELLALCKVKEINVVFVMKRRMLGYAVASKIPQSVFAISDYSGAHDKYQTMVCLCNELRTQYNTAINQHKVGCDMKCDLSSEPTEKKKEATVPVGPGQVHQERILCQTGDILTITFTTETHDIRFTIIYIDG
eukprot:Ihof_evm2s749 gene=Ihof_evmTU2s749